MAKGKLVKVNQLDAICPPKHVNTDIWVMISKETVGAEKVMLSLAEIHPGGAAEEDSHPGSEHGLFMISGVGEAFVGDRQYIVNPGECLWIPPGAKHGIKPVGGQTIRMVVFTAPPITLKRR